MTMPSVWRTAVLEESPVLPQLTHRWQSGNENQVSSLLPPTYNLITQLQGDLLLAQSFAFLLGFIICFKLLSICFSKIYFFTSEV